MLTEVVISMLCFEMSVWHSFHMGLKRPPLSINHYLPNRFLLVWQIWLPLLQSQLLLRIICETLWHILLSIIKIFHMYLISISWLQAICSSWSWFLIIWSDLSSKHLVSTYLWGKCRTLDLIITIEIFVWAEKWLVGSRLILACKRQR